MIDSGRRDVSLIADGWVARIFAFAFSFLLAWNGNCVDVIIAKVSVVLLAAKDVGLAVEDCNCVMGAS